MIVKIEFFWKEFYTFSSKNSVLLRTFYFFNDRKMYKMKHKNNCKIFLTFLYKNRCITDHIRWDLKLCVYGFKSKLFISFLLTSFISTFSPLKNFIFLFLNIYYYFSPIYKKRRHSSVKISNEYSCKFKIFL